MTDIRQALEEAFKVIHPEPFTSAVFKRARHPDDATHALDGLFPDWDKWNSTHLRFHRFLDAEAWTDAALMLVPEDTFPRLDFTMPQAILVRWGGRWEEVSRGGGLSMHEAILEAIAHAALRAKEAGDV